MIARLAAAFWLLSASLAAAQDGSITPLWLTPEAEIGAMPALRPALEAPQHLRTPLWRLGELAFRSPETLGGEARRAGLSCNACHPGGGAHAGFFIPGLSASPGTVDVTNSAWNPAGEDGRFNPVRIPLLWGAAATAPYGAAGRFPGLDGFIAHVIGEEFAGDPSPTLVTALTAFVTALPPPPNALLRADGRLSSRASEEAQAGREAFDKGCAGCHRPASAFQDGEVHRGRNTASLLGLAAIGLFFHDGRSASLDDAIVLHARDLGMTHGPDTRRRLGAHVRAIGAIDAPAMVPIRIGEEVERIRLASADLIEEDAATLSLRARMLRGEAGRVHARLPLEEHTAARGVLEGWAESLRQIGEAADGGDRAAAGRMAVELTGRISAERETVEAAGATSFYHPDRLAAWKSGARRTGAARP